MTPCPPAGRWPDLLAGELPADLGAHLDACPHCQGVLEASWADARQLLALPAADASAAVERLKRPPDTLDANDTDEGDDAQDVLDRLSPSAHAGALGTWGPYDVLAVRGRGGMGVVLRAFDAELNREVALKVQAPRLAHGAAARKRFRREAVAAAAVRHENVVPIHAVAEFAGLPYLVMEYVDGPSLQERIDRGGPLPVDEVLRIGAKLAAGLAAAHAAGLVHRDLKPANVLLSTDFADAADFKTEDRLKTGEERLPSYSPVFNLSSVLKSAASAKSVDKPLPKIADFGLARAADDPSLTATGVLCGTPAYMAPEQIVGDPVDWRADLYGLGGTLYALAAGRPPHAGATKLELLRQVCDGTVPPLRSIDRDIPVWLEEIVMTLLAKEPARRYPSAAAVGELLEGCLAHRRTGAPLPTGLRRPPPNRLRFATLALALCAVVAGVAIKLQTPDGTLIVEIDDPAVKVSVDGSELVITGAGVQELRVKPGPHTVATSRDGKPAEDEVVTVTSGGKQVVRVMREAKPAAGVSADADRRAMRYAAALDLAAKAPPWKEHDAGVLIVAVGETKTFQPLAKKPIRHVNSDSNTVVRVQVVVDDQTKIAVTGVAAGKAFVSLTDVEGRTEVLTVVVQTAAGGAAVPRPPVEGPELRLAAAVTSLAFTPDGKAVIAGAEDGTAYVWDLRTNKEWLRVAAHGRGPVAVAVSPDGKILVTGGEDGEVRAWDLPLAKQLWQTAVHQKTTAVAFLPDGKSVACGGGSATNKGSLQLLDAATGKPTSVFEFGHPAVGVAFHPTGGNLAVILADGSIATAPVTTGGTRAVVIAPDEDMAVKEDRAQFSTNVRVVAFAPDGQRFAMAYGDSKRLIVWQPLAQRDPFSAAGGRKWFDVSAIVDGIDAPAVVALAFSRDGRFLTTGGEAGDVKLWAVRVPVVDGSRNRMVRPLVTLQESGKAVRSVAFSPDGRYLASGGDDKTVRLWDVAGEPVPARR